MQVKTSLNRIQRFKSFVYGAVCWTEGPSGEPAIEAELRPRANGRARCSGCGCQAPGYDTLPERRFEFVPLWGIKVYFLYAPRRVECPRCGVRVERMPWASGKRHLTEAYAWFLARWVRRLSWQEVAEAFRRAGTKPLGRWSGPWSGVGLTRTCPGSRRSGLMRLRPGRGTST